MKKQAYQILSTVILLGLSLGAHSKINAQTIDFPNSSSESKVRGVVEDIFGNEDSMKLLSSYLQEAKKRGIHEAALAEIDVPDFVKTNEEWLKGRGIAIKWPKDTLEIEKAKYLADAVSEIRPYNRSNSSSKFEVQYFRSAEMADFLNEIYGEGTVEASPVALKGFESYETKPTVAVTGSNLSFVGIANNSSADELARFNIRLSEPVRVMAEKSPYKNHPQALFKLPNGNPVLVAMQDGEELRALQERLRKGAELRFDYYTQDGSPRLMVHTQEDVSIDPVESAVAIIRNPAPGQRYELDAASSISELEAADLKKANALYISDGASLAQAFGVVDPNYAKHLAENEKERQEKAARELARKQKREAELAARRAKEIRRQKEREAEALKREHERNAKDLLKALEDGQDSCQEPT